MSKYFFKNLETGNWETLVLRKDHAGRPGWYMVCLGDQKVGPPVIHSASGGWSTIPWKRKRGRALGRFRTRYDAAVYCLWADGVIEEDYSLM